MSLEMHLRRTSSARRVLMSVAPVPANPRKRESACRRFARGPAPTVGATSKPQTVIARLLSSLAVGVVVVMWSDWGHAQIVNVLQETGDVGEGTSGKVNSGTDWFNGNTDKLEISADAILRHRYQRHMALLMMQANYGENEGKANLDRQLAHARYRYFVQGPLHWEAFAQIDRNPFRRRRLRVLLGTGPRLQLLEGPQVRTAVGLAYMPEYEELQEEDATEADLTTWRHRLSSYLTHMVTLGRFNVSTTVYLQPDMGDIANVRAFADLSVEFTLLQSISLALSHSLQLDTEPPSAVRPADSLRTLSFAWTF